MDLIRTSFTDDPAVGPALARILLGQVAAGQRGPTLRIARTGPAVAFGRRDTVSPGYREAAGVAAELGYPGIERLSGGRATAYVNETLVIGITLPDREPARRTGERFDWVAGTVEAALGRLGFDAAIGPLPGEYCPGDHSINLEGRVKVAGLGQRMISGAAHVGVVLTLSGSDQLRDLLVPVYRALGIEWDPSTVGSLADLAPGQTAEFERVSEAIVAAFGRQRELVERKLDPATEAEATETANAYRSPLPLTGDRESGNPH